MEKSKIKWYVNDKILWLGFAIAIIPSCYLSIELGAISRTWAAMPFSVIIASVTALIGISIISKEYIKNNVRSPPHAKNAAFPSEVMYND